MAKTAIRIKLVRFIVAFSPLVKVSEIRSPSTKSTVFARRQRRGLNILERFWQYAAHKTA